MSFVKTITIFFTFQRLQSLLSRLSQYSLHFQRPSASFFKTIKVFFIFPKLSKYVVLQRLSMSSALFTFQRLQSLLSRLSQSSLHFQRPSTSFVKTIKIFFIFPRLSKFVVLQRLSMSSAFYISKTSMSFVKTIKVLFTFQRPSEFFVKTIIVFFTFPRLSESFVVKTITTFFTFPRLSESFIVKTIKVFFTFQKLSKSFVGASMSHLQCKTSRSFVLYMMPLTFFLFTGFTTWVFASSQSDGKIARMKLVSLSLLTFSFSIKDK